MVVYARPGSTIEVMGLMQGKTDINSIIVTDVLTLHVVGTKIRVNSQVDAYEYMVYYSQANKFDDWRMLLDGTILILAINTGCLFQEPFVAIVINLTRIVSTRKVEIKFSGPTLKDISLLMILSPSTIEDFVGLAED
ncbi:hypothetical protein J1N35_003395 [Gossypium stocksii]|uniref:JAB1/MPN/MOV34 metalloenzyme domain-containing protein n=1 Tax=Gossypium stocksii TaxID=47602 RepID=A0A9D4ANS3_9ROSI|nr:hypothetical protein J1N35_003395 [Gossypium stocksii]